MVRKKFIIYTFFALILLLSVLGIWAYQYNPYFRFAMKELIYHPSGIVSQFNFGVYLIKYGTKLSFNERTKKYDFSQYRKHNQLNNFDDALILIHEGNFEKASKLLAKYNSMNKKTATSLFWEGMANLRLAEQVNCQARLLNKAGHSHSKNHQHLSLLFDDKFIKLTNRVSHSQKMCALPLVMVHADKNPGRKAADIFLNLLDNYDSNNVVWKWLYNFALITIDDYPPKKDSYKIDSSFMDFYYGKHGNELAKKYKNIIFNEKASDLNIDAFDAGRGVAVEDFNRDGYLDIIVSGQYSGLKYFQNVGGKNFIDITDKAGLGSVGGSFKITAADYNNDGWVDLFVSATLDGKYGNIYLFENDGTGFFKNVSKKVGLSRNKNEKNMRKMTTRIAFGDIDNDGDLDLLIGAFSFFNYIDPPFTPTMSPRLYVFDKGKYIDKTKEYGLSKYLDNQCMIDATFGDFNNDGFIDLYLTNLTRGDAALLENVGGQKFQKRKINFPNTQTFTTSIIDINHDGLLDLFVGGLPNAYETTENVVFSKNIDSPLTSNYIMLQNKDGSFTKKDFPDLGLAGAMGANFGDVNNDGAYDFYIGTGNPQSDLVIPNLFYLGIVEKDGKIKGNMENISIMNGFANIQKGHGIVFFDFDNDGDQDIYSSLGGMWPGDKWPNQFFVNDSKDVGKWVKIRLHGTKNNYYGLGSIIKIYAEDKKGHKIIRTYHMDNKTGFGSAPYIAHVGLGKATKIMKVEVTWLGKPKKTQTYKDIKLNALNILEEG